MKSKEKVLALILSIYFISSSLIPSKVSIFQVDLPLSDIMFLMILITFITIVLMSKEYKRKVVRAISSIIHNKLDISLIVFFLIMCFSTLYSLEKVLAIKESIRFASYLVIYFIIKYFITSERWIKLLINSIIVNIYIVCSFGAFQYITNFKLKEEYIVNYDYIKRIPSTLENPNSLAGYLILFLFPMIMLTIMHFNNRKVNFKFIMYALLSAMILLGLILTGSRNGYVGIFIGIISLSILYSFKLLLSFGVLGFIGIINPKVMQRVLALFDASKNSSRLKLWKLGGYMIKDHPILGVGNGNYVTYYDIYSEKYPNLRYGDYKRFSSHNTFIKIQSELGLIGSVSFILVIVFVVKEILEFVRSVTSQWWKVFYIGFFASTISFLVMSISDNLLFVPKIALYFWAVIAIMESYKHNVIYKYKN